MPKRVFWPATLLIMGLIFLASNMGYLPMVFWNFWPLILIIVGLGGLVISDREDWYAPSAKPKAKRSKSKAQKRVATKAKKTTKSKKK